MIARALSTVMLCVMISSNVFGQAEPDKKSPKQIIDEIVKNAKTAPDGTTQPSTGRAKPVENWFGCKPSENQNHNCKESKKTTATENGQGR